MLKTVAPEASYEQISGRILQNRDFQVGGKPVSQSWLWNLGISGECLGGLWGVSEGSWLCWLWILGCETPGCGVQDRGCGLMDPDGGGAAAAGGRRWGRPAKVQTSKEL